MRSPAFFAALILVFSVLVVKDWIVNRFYNELKYFYTMLIKD